MDRRRVDDHGKPEAALEWTDLHFHRVVVSLPLLPRPEAGRVALNHRFQAHFSCLLPDRAAVVPRSDAYLVTERPCEMTLVGKARVERDLDDRYLRPRQPVGCPIEPQPPDVGPHRGTKPGSKGAREIVRMHPAHRGAAATRPSARCSRSASATVSSASPSTAIGLTLSGARTDARPTFGHRVLRLCER